MSQFIDETGAALVLPQGAILSPGQPSRNRAARMPGGVDGLALAGGPHLDWRSLQRPSRRPAGLGAFTKDVFLPRILCASSEHFHVQVHQRL